MDTYRQGDVLVQRIDSIPDGVSKKSNTVALGEVTGHHHTFDGGAQVFGAGEQQYVQIVRESVLSHQEHDAITLPKGTYQVVLQREHDLLSGVRQVMD